jgi:hypothetical protein
LASVGRIRPSSAIDGVGAKRASVALMTTSALQDERDDQGFLILEMPQQGSVEALVPGPDEHRHSDAMIEGMKAVGRRSVFGYFEVAVQICNIQMMFTALYVGP